MALVPGTRLGPYEITAQIGVGGMGEVYRARDTKLDRDVAIKVLPDLVAQDAERLARFDREAKTLAALNHPGIAAIYGLEESDGIKALVMELVEGPTLADRIARGAIPVDEALPIAKQIAEALEAAHEQGIIHRDLKPANVKVRHDGSVKVLDFGLAKAIEPAGTSSSASASMSPTITTPAMTQMGMILGTAAYMSPEQARGKAVDKRADIWAFGCVVYEMLTGTRAFTGDDVTDTIVSVVSKEPDWAVLPQGLPAAASCVRRCLQKDPRQRFRDMGDVRLALEGAFESVPFGLVGGAVPGTTGWRRVLPFAAGAAAGVLGLWLAAPHPGPVPGPTNRFTLGPLLPPPRGNVLRTPIALSHDGRSLAYVTAAGLYLRRMGELEARPIAGTEDVTDGPICFSPDGQSLVYAAWNEDALKRVPVTGGAAVTVASGIGSRRPDAILCASDGAIYYSIQAAGIYRKSQGAAEAPELLASDWASSSMRLLPDGDTLLFSGPSADGAPGGEVVALTPSTGRRTVVLTNASQPYYLPTGHLVYVSNGALVAAPFDLESLAVSGAAVPVLQGPAPSLAFARHYAVSDAGTLAYLAGAPGGAPERRLAFVNRQGRTTSVIEKVDQYSTPRLSPDGKRIAVEIADTVGNTDIWIIDVERQTQRRLTTDAAVDQRPLWTPDGSRIVFSSNRAGPSRLYWMAADGSDTAAPLTSSADGRLAESEGATSWMADGSRLVYYRVNERFDLFSLAPGAEPERLTATPFAEKGPVFSPDGHWLAFSYDDTDRPEIYVAPYPGLGERIPVSTDGGMGPRWSADGRELYYRQGTQMMAVPIQWMPTLRVGTPQLLFDRRDVRPEGPANGVQQYDVSKDGRFLVLESVDAAGADASPAPQVVIVQNWFEELTRLVPNP